MEKNQEIQGLNVFYVEEGEGVPILILHGWSASTESWRETQKHLVDRGFRVIVPDLPGFGQTDEPEDIWNLSDYMEFVRNFAKALNLHQFVLAGHSFGGRIAIKYAQKNARELRALVLMSAAGVIRHKDVKTRLFIALTKMGDWVFSKPGLSVFKEPVKKIWHRFASRKDYKKASPKMKEILKRVIAEELKAYLPHIKTHTLILWGDKDVLTPVSDGFLLHQTIPLSHMHVFPDMPHAINLKAPKEIAKQISLFIKGEK